MTKSATTTIGLIVGGLVGYPASYFFQAAAVRAKLSMGDYVQHIGDVLHSKDMSVTAIGVWIASVVIFAFLGMLFGSSKTKSRPSAR